MLVACPSHALRGWYLQRCMHATHLASSIGAASLRHCGVDAGSHSRGRRMSGCERCDRTCFAWFVGTWKIKARVCASALCQVHLFVRRVSCSRLHHGVRRDVPLKDTGMHGWLPRCFTHANFSRIGESVNYISAGEGATLTLPCRIVADWSNAVVFVVLLDVKLC